MVLVAAVFSVAAGGVTWALTGSVNGAGPVFLEAANFLVPGDFLVAVNARQWLLRGRARVAHSARFVPVAWSACRRRREGPKVPLAVTVGVVVRMATAMYLGVWSVWEVLNMPPTDGDSRAILGRFFAAGRPPNVKNESVGWERRRHGGLRA